MHWLAEQLRNVENIDPASSQLREFLRSLVNQIVERKGVTACFASHDGLLVAGAGRVPDLEALSALTQAWSVTGNETASSLALGDLRQMVLVGSHHKLAIFQLGSMVLGILGQSEVELGDALAR